MYNIEGLLIIISLVLIVLFIIGREIACWYWKINDITTTLARIDDKLSKIINPNSTEVKETNINKPPIDSVRAYKTNNG